MSEVAATRTPLTRDATAVALVPAYLRVFGVLPDRNRAELLLAQVWLENANGQSIIDHNIGNLTTTAAAGVDYWRPPWFDRDAVEARPADDKNRARYLMLNDRMKAGGAPSAFRAFGSFDEGFDAWLRQLQRMQPILDAASSGSPDAFARAIYTTKYCPDPECRDAGPSYAKLRDQIRAAGYFEGLEKKKVPPAAEALGLWFWCWGLQLRRLTSGTRIADDGARLLSGEP